MTDRLYNDNDQVAVIVSPGHGAGWSTWNLSYKECAFDKDIAEAILEKNFYKAEEIAEKKYPESYTGGLSEAVVVWLEPGTKFRIHEYDGHESLVIFSDEEYLMA